MPDFKFWQRWLLAVSVIFIIFGVATALFNWTPLFFVFDMLVNNTFWAGLPSDPGIQGFRLWTYGMLGGTIAGWGVFLAYITRYPFARKEAWAWKCIVAGIATWFVIDTAVSAYVAAYFNVAINVLLLALVALPVAMTRGEFIKK